jgi:hypothetical protein
MHNGALENERSSVGAYLTDPRVRIARGYLVPGAIRAAGTPNHIQRHSPAVDIQASASARNVPQDGPGSHARCLPPTA